MGDVARMGWTCGSGFVCVCVCVVGAGCKCSSGEGRRVVVVVVWLGRSGVSAGVAVGVCVVRGEVWGGGRPCG